MKKIICSLFLYLLVSVFTVYADDTPILLIGEAPAGPVKSLPQPDGVLATQSKESVQLYFTANIGVVEICIKNALGKIAYQEAVDTKLTPYIIIDTTSWPSGNYVITITLTSGYRLYGKFSL